MPAERNLKMQAPLKEKNDIKIFILYLMRNIGYPLDFSNINDDGYYNGIIFKGYINNVPKVVLSGGRYDKLMEKLDKKAEAIGFAVYLGEIEKYIKDDIRFDADVLLTYTDADCAQDVFKKATELRSSGKSVRVQKTEGKVRYGEILRSEDVSL